jgi:hypothetical protein
MSVGSYETRILKGIGNLILRMPPKPIADLKLKSFPEE